MAKFLFKDSRFAGYYFDDTDNCVYSTKRPGAPAKLTWQKRNSWSPAFVTLSYKSGAWQCRDTKTLDQVRAALKATLKVSRKAAKLCRTANTLPSA